MSAMNFADSGPGGDYEKSVYSSGLDNDFQSVSSERMDTKNLSNGQLLEPSLSDPLPAYPLTHTSAFSSASSSSSSTSTPRHRNHNSTENFSEAELAQRGSKESPTTNGREHNGSPRNGKQYPVSDSVAVSPDKTRNSYDTGVPTSTGSFDDRSNRNGSSQRHITPIKVAALNTMKPKATSSRNLQTTAISPSTSNIPDSPVDPQKPVSTTKALAALQSIPSNRSCADCHSPLIDSSKIYASFHHASLKNELKTSKNMDDTTRITHFRNNHSEFAPPGEEVDSRMSPSALNYRNVDPAISASVLSGGHGVFLCASCGLVHQSLGRSITIVKSVQGKNWVAEEVEIMQMCGGNARSWAVYERYMPQHWTHLRPNSVSTSEQRQVFARAKYEALAFLFPHGPLASKSWGNLVLGGVAGKWSAGTLVDLNDTSMHIDKASSEKSRALKKKASFQELPERMVDFFCVVGTTGKLERNPNNPREPQDLSKCNSPEDVYFMPGLLDCYPAIDSYEDMELPSHLSKFVFPEGCVPKIKQKEPSFFSFVLTLENGSKLYGAALVIYDETIETESIRDIGVSSGYNGEWPSWLKGDDNTATTDSSTPPKSNVTTPEILYLPKALVVLSHYSFDDVWRSFLKQIYRISIVQAPLPIERYVANFVSELPLPPLGKIEVKFGFTDEYEMSITRPPSNRLPLVGFSYQPLFSCLSVGNIMVVMGLLLQETRVALCSEHYSLLGPVAEALVSLLHPFAWQGLFLPVMPFSMLDILDAPVPFLVGLHSRYLTDFKAEYRPDGVAFINLDNDTIHLGFDDDQSPMSSSQPEPRFPPVLPDKDASKLKSKLDQYGGKAYLIPSSGFKTRILTSADVPLRNEFRESYAYMYHLDLARETTRRRTTLSKADQAFFENELLTPISGFVSDQGHMAEREVAKQESWKMKGLKVKKDKKKSNIKANSSINGAASKSAHLLEKKETDDFSPKEIRYAFLRFFVSIFKNYEKFIRPKARGDKFLTEAFLDDLSFSTRTRSFMKKVVSSQMFARFVDERIENRKQPEVLFFDESILAKNNRSKKSTLISGGKTETPFLADNSGDVSETFTPPPPSNWGLPDDERLYDYGSFPSLDTNLFGKVRPPKKWPQISRQGQRATSSRFRHKQQEILSKAFQHLNSPSDHNDTSSEIDVEWAIHALAYWDSTSNIDSRADIERRKRLLRKGINANLTDKVSVKKEMVPKAKRLVLAERRKQSILLTLVMKVQAWTRMHVQKRRYQQIRYAVTVLQYQYRLRPIIREVKDHMATLLTSIRLVQRVSRGIHGRKVANVRRHSVLLVQAWTRGSLARLRLLQFYSARRIQCWVRGVIVRDYVTKLCNATIIVQSCVRGRRIRFAYRQLEATIARLQSMVRGFMTRKLLQRLRVARVTKYRTHMFDLWKRTFTPLTYRTKFWQIIDGSGFLHLTLIENELERLWTDLAIEFPPEKFTNGSKESDSHLSFATGFKEVTNITYRRYIQVELMKKNATLGHVAEKTSLDIFPVFPGEMIPKKMTEEYKIRKGKRKDAADQLAGERSQVYEKLAGYTDKKKIQSIYASFDLGGQKLKKQKLAQTVWTSYDHVSASTATIIALFPELDESTNVGYVKISSKGVKRMGNTGSSTKKRAVMDKSLWVQDKVGKLIEKNMKEVAMGLLKGMQSLIVTRENENKKGADERLIQLERQRLAIANARSSNAWKAFRMKIMRYYVHKAKAHYSQRSTKRMHNQGYNI